MTKPTGKICPTCKETEPVAKFYGPKSLYKMCKACVSDYNRKFYLSQKAQTNRLRKSHKRVGNARCIECLEMSVNSLRVFTTFCQARRMCKKIGGYHTNCSDCGLGKKVDSGFMPVNISVMAGAIQAVNEARQDKPAKL